MFSIRKGTFETNSSSTHSICIAQNVELDEIPEKITIDLDDYEFGWEVRKRTDMYDKLAYLFLGILDVYDSLELVGKAIDTLLNQLYEIGVRKVNFEINKASIWTYDNNKSKFVRLEYSYIDHGNELLEMVEDLLSNTELLKYYLFTDKSFIITGNDNSDYSRADEISKDKLGYEFIQYYKGN